MDFNLKVSGRDANLIAQGLNALHAETMELLANLQAQATTQEAEAANKGAGDTAKETPAIAVPIEAAPKQRKKRGPNKPKANGAASKSAPFAELSGEA